ncbi:MAG: PKD domain-containing protein [Bacteroidetes bacterium]|nr:PKD domain-containing protein [Bacteroidota bacterium]
MIPCLPSYATKGPSRRLLSILLLFLLTSIARAHTIELRALLNNDGSATFYARTYHGTGELPSGGFIIDGVTYPFVGTIPATALPAGSQLISSCSYPFSNSDNYQYVTVPAFNSCVAHAFNCTSGAPETPYCTLANTLTLGAPQITVQPAYGSGSACLGSAASVVVAAAGQNLTYQWQVNTGSGFNNITDDAVYSGSATTTLTISTVTAAMTSYIFRAVVSASNPCGGVSSTNSNDFPLTISYPPSITAQPADVTICSSGNAGFQVTASGTAITYQWQLSTDNGGTWNNIPGQTTNALQLTGVTTAFDKNQYRVVVSGTCPAPLTSNAATLNVEIPVAGFTVNKTDQCSDGNNFLFTNTSTVNHGTLHYAWDFGDGKTGTDVHPTHIYTAQGSYVVKLVATGTNGCQDTKSGTVVVHAMPDASLTVNKAAQCLSVNAFTFTSTSTISDGSTLTSNWDFGDGSGATTASANKTYPQAGYYRVVLTARSPYGCTDTAQATIRVAPDPVGFIVPPSSSAICQGSSVTLQASGGITYQWYRNGTQIPSATTNIYQATQAGVYTVSVVNDAGCSSMATNSITLTLTQKPTAAFTYTNNCAGRPVLFSNTTVSNAVPLQYTWDYGDNVRANVTQSAHTYALPGTYTVKLIAAPTGCSLLADTATQTITIQGAPPGTRLTPVNATVNVPIQLQARDMNVTYQWRPSAGLSNAAVRTPTATLQNETTFFIDMQSAAGCITTDTLLVRIFRNNDVFVPTGFTPDGDGRNDVFRVTLVQAREFHYLRVFNRSGRMIFETTDATRGWDGSWNGRPQPADTYMWSCEAIGLDGKLIRKSGSVTLIR